MAFSITSVSAFSGTVGQNITINGTGFGASQGGSYVAVGGLVQTIVSWSDTSIVFAVAADDTMGDLVVFIQYQLYGGPFGGPGQP